MPTSVLSTACATSVSSGAMRTKAATLKLAFGCSASSRMRLARAPAPAPQSAAGSGSRPQGG
ncbi:hypothetical protein E6W36_09520 [Hankyongella ginsenosidimutans]|uniref:Uncharacterized protein n=1 Tax=Hankyongella ginsenosidimutans TaxID=1763828 RepID=A0A4D7CC46_9SPHN|nr:hypothetical protein E6W36_09520 [Hankyongella ginsenosidimutans]